MKAGRKRGVPQSQLEHSQSEQSRLEQALETEELRRELRELKEALVAILLRGYTLPTGRRVYLKPSEEARHRQVLAELLRSNDPLSRNVRDALADHIAPNDEVPWEREIVFRFRGKGRPKDLSFEGEVGGFVLEHLMDGRKVEDGIQAAMDRFGLERRQVERIWSEYRRKHKLMGFEF